MSYRYTVYVSVSTLDSIEYYWAIRGAILSLDMTPVMVNKFDIGSEAIIHFLQKETRSADIFIGIYTEDYGWCPQNYGGKSIIEIEYNWAKLASVPCIPFFGTNLADVSSKSQSEIATLKLNQFKDRLKREVPINNFDSPENLNQRLTVELARTREFLIQRGSNPHPPQTGLISDLELENLISRVVKIQESQISIEKSAKKELTDNGIFVSPVFGTPPAMRQFQCDIFVIMPFAAKFQPVYNDIIKSVSRDLNLITKRGDDFFTHHNIIDEIWSAIYSCKLVIADCTNRNPNVFYELGIAHTLGKSTILITQDIKDIPFDVQGRRFIVYEDKIAGMKALESQLNAAILKILNEIE